MDKSWNVRKHAWDWDLSWLWMFLFIIFLFGIIGFACSTGYFVSESDTIKAVEKQGYKNIVITERHQVLAAYYGCGREDSVAFHARAINPAGQEVDITICAGWLFKGVTVRTK